MLNSASNWSVTGTSHVPGLNVLKDLAYETTKH